MIEMTRKEMIDRIILFKGANVYTYIKDNFGYFYNGYVLNLNEIQTQIVFKDDQIGEIPIRVEDIGEITYSKRNKIQGEDKNVKSNLQ